MPKYPEDTIKVSVPPPGRWVWSDESQTLEFVSSHPAGEGVLRKRSQTTVSFEELQQRAQWLAEICTLNRRGRQSTVKGLSRARLNAYRSSVMERQRDRVTVDDVKQVAVSLLQENYLLPIPPCFLDVLKSKELDEVLTALLLYLSCFFEHKSLENEPTPSVVVDIITERRMKMETLAKKEIAQKKLAVCYFRLMMDLERGQHRSYRQGQMLSNKAEWLLHACLYSFFCYVAWVTFGRQDLRDIQEEVGRLLYSDTFNVAVRSRTDGDSGMTSVTVTGSVKTGGADPEETRCDSSFKQRLRPNNQKLSLKLALLPRVDAHNTIWRVASAHTKRLCQETPSGTSRRRLALGSIANQRSPLMVALLPSPKERSPHLFPGSRPRSQSPLQPEHCDTKALTEQLDQQLAGVSFGILGQPLGEFHRSTLTPYGEQKNNRDEDDESAGDVNNDGTDRPGVHVQGGKLSFVGSRRALPDMGAPPTQTTLQLPLTSHTE